MIAYLLILHFIGDFLFQSREMGKKKSSEAVWLVRHLLILTSVLYAGLTPLLFAKVISGPVYLFLPLCNCIVHGVIDWNIWKGYKLSVYLRDNKTVAETWQYWEDHLFYVTIGLDQLLHALTFIILLGVL